MAWTEQLPSGRWRGSYRLASGASRSAGTFAHKSAAMNAAAAAEAKARSLGWRDPRAGLRTWGDWCDEWWPTRGVEASTLKKDASRRDSRLAPRWRSVPLIEITRHDVKAWAAELAADGLAQSTVQRCVHLLSASLAAAVDAEIIPTNPASRIGVKVGDTTKERFLTQKEAQKLLAELDDDSVDEALVSLLIGTGLRWGEAVGLRVERVDLERGIVRVAEVWDNVNGVMKAYPKSRRRRTVPLPKWVAKKLKPLVKGRADGHVFLSAEGQAIDYSNWRRRTWVPAVAAAGIRALTIHDLRHTYASWLIQDGVPLEEVGRLLGHVSPLTTRRYAHLAETPRELVLAALPDPSKKAKRGASVEQKAPKRAGTGLYRAVDNRAGKTG